MRQRDGGAGLCRACPLPLCVYSGASPGVVYVLLYPLCRHRPFFSSLTLFSAFGLSLPTRAPPLRSPFLVLVWFGFCLAFTWYLHSFLYFQPSFIELFEAGFLCTE